MLTFTENPRVDIVRGSSFEDYRSAEGLNQSLMKLHDPDYDGCPALYRYRCNRPDDNDTQARREGRAFHALVLEPTSFKDRYRILDPELAESIFQEAKSQAIAAKKKSLIATAETLADFRAKGGKAFDKCQPMIDWLEGDSREVVSADFAHNLESMVEAIHANADIMEELAGIKLADCEVSGFSAHTFKDGEIAGKHLGLKARFDILCIGDAIIDAKTCRSTSHRKFSADVARYGYDLQAAHYLKVANANGLKKKRFGFLAQEKEQPHLNCIHWMPSDWLDYARIRHRKILSDIAENIRLGRWPGPETGMLRPPSYLESEIEALAA